MPETPAKPDLIELTRLAFEATNRRDIDAVANLFAPDAILDGRVVGDHFVGRAAIGGFLDEWFGSFVELRFEVEEFVVLDDEVVLTAVNQEGRPAGGDGHVHQREGWVVCWSADSLIERLMVHADIDEARAAAERFVESRAR
jgi:uncharacterized protein (TIGR02246 family)